MNLKTAALEVMCPACGAQPKEPCLRINGAVMPEPHTKRKTLALAQQIPNPHGDPNQADTTIVRDVATKP
jgi:hypothetical protein